MSTSASVSHQLDYLFAGKAFRTAEDEMPIVLIVGSDAKFRDRLADVLDRDNAKIQWAGGVEAVKSLFENGRVSACLCGFELEDGTYRDVVKHARRQLVETPVIIASTPHCPNEYREYLTAMNAGAFDFLCYPYQKRELDRILGLALTSFRRKAASHRA